LRHVGQTALPLPFFAYAMPLPFYCGKLLSFDFGLPQSIESRLFLISAFRVNPKATIFQFQLSATWRKVFFFDLGVSAIGEIFYFLNLFSYLFFICLIKRVVLKR